MREINWGRASEEDDQAASINDMPQLQVLSSIDSSLVSHWGKEIIKSAPELSHEKNTRCGYTAAKRVSIQMAVGRIQ